VDGDHREPRENDVHVRLHYHGRVGEHLIVLPMIYHNQAHGDPRTHTTPR
jgi:hypothetical protein